MRYVAICAFIILLSTTTSVHEAYGQTKTGPRGRRTRSVKRVKPVAKSPVTITPSGLIYIITRRSDGRIPKAGETVAVHYTGVLTNGVKFDSSLDRGEPFKFRLGLGQVIKGWDEGIGKLRVGEQATLVVPAALGYGANGAGGVIPPNATLIFIVELVGVEGTPTQ